jgi:hypothetical protein
MILLEGSHFSIHASLAPLCANRVRITARAAWSRLRRPRRIEIVDKLVRSRLPVIPAEQGSTPERMQVFFPAIEPNVNTVAASILGKTGMKWLMYIPDEGVR